MPDSPQRLFLALLPDAGVRGQLVRLQKDLAQAGGRPVPGENLHLTLLFLGDVEAGKVERVRDLAANTESRRLDLTLDTFGSFRQNHARILWLGPSEEIPELNSLHHSLRRGTKDAGLPVRKEAYRPHVTLIRQAGLRKRLPGKPDQSILWTACRLALVASELRPDGSRYEILAEKVLGK